MIVHLSKEFRFEASHQLPNHDGKCARLHGHSWVLTVGISGHVNNDSDSPKEGMVLDFSALKNVMSPIIDNLDHHHLGEGLVTADKCLGKDFPVPPTSENILIWIALQLENACFSWEYLKLQETCTSAAILIRGEYLSGI